MSKIKGPMEVEIEKADIEQLDLLLKWRLTVLEEVFDCHDPEQLKNLESQNRIYYQKALPEHSHIACFAREKKSGKIVGCGGICFYQEMPSPDNPDGSCGYLMNIYTLPEFRKQGIAKAVVLWLIDQAMERKTCKIYLETSNDARNLYASLGFVPMKDMLILKREN